MSLCCGRVLVRIMCSGHRECVNSLVGTGADVNAKDKKQYTPLHSAAAGGQAHTVKLLLELGADVCLYVDVLHDGTS